MKKVIILLMLVLLSKFNVAYCFSDIQNHWAENYILWGLEEEIVNGYENESFKPDGEIKVSEFLKILVEASKYKKEMIGDRWPDWYIATAKKHEWITEEQIQNYEKYITRNEAVEIISKYIDVKNVNKSNIKLKDLNADNKENVLKLIELGVINGYSDNTFKGEKTITRAEAIKIIKAAVDARQKIINEKNYKITNDMIEVTNVGKKPKESLYRNRYEIKNNEIYFYDDGRYAILDEYKLKNEYIDKSKMIKMLKQIISEDTYTSVNYVPDSNTINQLIVSHGDRESYLYNGSERFSITFYENKLYNLKTVTLEDSFSDKCFMKIKVTKLWLWKNELKDGSYINKYKLERLENAIEAIFGKNVTEELIPYIKQKVVEGQLRNENEKIIDTIRIGKYKIDTYAYEGARVEFYISEI